jgi:hypothetical protein
MAVTRVMPAVRAHPKRGPYAARRTGARIWALLHAPALLSGWPADLRDPAVAEDDRFRLGRRR